MGQRGGAFGDESLSASPAHEISVKPEFVPGQSEAGVFVKKMQEPTQWDHLPRPEELPLGLPLSAHRTAQVVRHLG